MPEENRQIPRPPFSPPNIPQTPPQGAGNTEPETQSHKRGLSPKAKFGLLIAGGVFSLSVAAACLILLFIL